MSSWADVSEEASSPPDRPAGGGGFDGGGGGAPPRERPRLQLKPRSAQGVAQAQATDAAHRKSNPFGAAKPREEVLAQKGVDPKMVDSRIEKKAEVLHLTKEQEDEVEAVRAELTRAEEKLREANEMELPEETYRVACENKKKELNDLMAKFAEMSTKKKDSGGPGGAGGGRGGGGGRGDKDGGAPGQRRHYERPSERRKRLDEERGGGGGGGRYQDDDYDGGGGDDPFKSFGGRSRRSGGGGRSGRGGGSTGNPHWD